MKYFIYELLKAIYTSVDKILKLLLSLIGILYLIPQGITIFYSYLLLIWWIIYAITDMIKWSKEAIKKEYKEEDSE